MNDVNSRNPYQSPSTTSFAQTTELRTDFGFRLGWSLFWRVFVLQWFGVFAVDALRYVPLDIGQFKQVLICLGLALISALSLLCTKHGALYFLFGDRLRLADSAWRKFHWLLVAYYGAMLAWNLVAVFVLVDVTAKIKITVSLASWLFFFVIVPRLLRTETDVE